jgi:hypothetical protein
MKRLEPRVDAPDRAGASQASKPPGAAPTASQWTRRATVELCKFIDYQDSCR